MKRNKKEIPCQALSSSGKRCMGLPTKAIKYFGDSELYGFDDNKPYWVRVYFCKKHWSK